VTSYRGRHRSPGGAAARRFAALGLLSSSTLAAVMFIAPSPVSANAPDVAAWWNAANVGDPAPAPPAPPDVKEGDLLVQGSNPADVPSPLGAAPATTTAVAGLGFDLPPSALLGPLTLQIDGSAPPQVSVVACRATETFTSDENGPWSQVPPYDGNACVPGKLKDTNVVFSDVDKLVSHNALRVLILPGPVDRVVFKPPSDGTLVVKDSGGIGAAAPPIGAGTGSTTTGGAGSSGTASVGGSAVTGPPATSSGGLPTTGTTSTPGSDVAPVVAGEQPGSPVAQQSSARAASSGLSTRNRRIIALIVIAAEVLGYALLMRNRAPVTAPATAAAIAGGRLRAPDRWAGGRAAAMAGSAGVGRFRRERTGPAPHL
jgi:hypothetical protein